MSDIVEKVRELSEIKAEIDRLGIRKAELEKYISEQACVDIEDTKYKSVTYSDPNSQARVTYTASKTLSIEMENSLKAALAAVCNDVFTEETKTVVKPKTKSMERMLIGIYRDDFLRIKPDDVIKQLPCDEKTKRVLSKKLKGANFETDCESLIKFGGMTEKDAKDYAYMYAEATVWETFCRVRDLSGIPEDKLLINMRNCLKIGDSTKIAVT